jgi:hypothetical protein
MRTHQPNPLPPEADREIAKILVAAEKEKLRQVVNPLIPTVHI